MILKWGEECRGGGVGVCVCGIMHETGVGGGGGRGGTIISWQKTTNSCNRGELS